MSTQALQGKTVGILVMDNFEQVELTGPREALQAAGAETRIVSAKAGEVTGMNHDEKADRFPVDLTFDAADPAQFDALLLPGGVFSSDAIRSEPGAQRLVQAVSQAGKPIAVICHGPWLLVSAGLVKGRTLTSYPSVHDDIRNAGGTWKDAEVVVDRNWVSSRKPDDIPAFNREFLRMLGER